MKSFKHFLEESELPPNIKSPFKISKVDEEFAIEWIKDNLSSKKYNNGGILFKGFSNTHQLSGFNLIDTSGFERISRDTNGIYQYLMDDSLALSNYPKRSNSLICSTSQFDGAPYGRTFAVIPLKNSLLAVSQKSDFLTQWIKPDVEFYSDFLRQSSLNTLTQALGVAIFAKNLLKVDKITLKNKINELSENELMIMLDINNDAAIKTFKKLKQKCGDNFTTLSTILMTPTSLELTLNKYGDALSERVECWFTGTSLVLDYIDRFLPLMDKIKNENI